jgi:DNA-binding NtrC family response regulator
MKWRAKTKTVEERTVLFVDDNEIVLQSLERGLLDEPYNKFFAKSAKEALEILQREEVHVIVTDMCMPEMTGLELLRIVRKEYPHTIRIILSGYTKDPNLQKAVYQGEIFYLIPKPWKLGVVHFEAIIQKAVDYYNLQSERVQSGDRKLKQCKAILKE